MNYEINGTIIEIGDVQQITETFKKREFVIENKETIPGRDEPIVNYVKFQLIQNKTDLIDAYNSGQDINVNFNIKGNKWTNKEGIVQYFTNLEAWRINPASNAEAAPVEASSAEQEEPNFDLPESTDEMPF